MADFLASPPMDSETIALVTNLGQMLKMGDRPDLAVNAAQQVGRMAPRLDITAKVELVTMLAGSLDDPSPFVRSAIAIALGQLGDPAASHVGRIAQLMGDSDPGVRETAVRALGLTGAKISGKYQSAIAELLSDSNPQVKVAVANALGNLGKLDPAAAGLANLLTEDHHYVRAAGLEAIRTLGEDAGAAAANIDQIMTNTALSADIRVMAVEAMAELGPNADDYSEHLAQLLPLEPLKNEVGKPLIGKAATKALTTLKQNASKALPELVRLLKDNDDQVKKNAYNTLTGMELWDKVPENEKNAYISLQNDKKTAAAARR